MNKQNVAQAAAIKQFTKAMKKASVGFIATFGRPTMAMKSAWALYVEACKELAALGVK